MNYKKITVFTVILLALLSLSYYAYWQTASRKVKTFYAEFIAQHSAYPEEVTSPTVSGFPFNIKLESDAEYLKIADGTFNFKNLLIEASPFFNTPTHIEASDLTIIAERSPIRFEFDQFEGDIDYKANTFIIDHATLNYGELKIAAKGLVMPEVKPPQIDLMLGLENYTEFLNDLIKAQVLKPETAMLITTGLSAFRDKDGNVNIPLTTQPSGHLFAGPIPIGKLK